MSANDKPPSYEEATGESSSGNSSSWTTISPTSIPSVDQLLPGPSCSNPPPPPAAGWAATSSSWAPSCPSEDLACSSSSGQSGTAPHPAGWAPMPLALVVNKEKEALASLQQQENITNNNTETYPELPEKCPQPSVVIPPTVPLAPCPPGLEILQDVTDMLLRENFVPHPRGGSRRGAVLLKGDASLLIVQRCPSVHHHRHAPRALELVDSSGGSVIARLESTKRGDILSAEVQSPPGSRISRAELRPGPSVIPQLTATVLSADEKTALRVPTLPPLGELETQPMLQVENSTGEPSGALQWAWSTDADLMQVQIRLPQHIDVRIKVATIALALLCMEAFSSRWSRGGEGQPRSLHRLHVRGHRKRHR